MGAWRIRPAVCAQSPSARKPREGWIQGFPDPKNPGRVVSGSGVPRRRWTPGWRRCAAWRGSGLASGSGPRRPATPGCWRAWPPTWSTSSSPASWAATRPRIGAACTLPADPSPRHAPHGTGRKRAGCAQCSSTSTLLQDAQRGCWRLSYRRVCFEVNYPDQPSS